MKLSLCKSCNCMTETYWSFCSKCLNKKENWCNYCSLKCSASDCECICHEDKITRKQMDELMELEGEKEE